MPTVHFLPADISIDVPASTLIHEAAAQAGVEELHLPCGGKGTCGKCLVEVISGQPEQLSHSHLDKSLAGKGLVLACQCKVTGDLTIRLRQDRSASLQVVGDSHLLINEDLLPDHEEISPLYRMLQLTVPPATIDEHYSDWQRLLRELTRELGSASISTDCSITCVATKIQP